MNVPNISDEAKTKSRDYFNTHRKSKQAHVFRVVEITVID